MFFLIPFRFDRGFSSGGRNVRCVRRGGRFSKNGVHFGFIEAGFFQEQFDLIGMQVVDAVGFGGEAGQGIKSPLFFEDGDALFLFPDMPLLLVDVERELLKEGTDSVAHRLRQLIDQRLEFSGKSGGIH
jgi:hypothetical protein